MVKNRIRGLAVLVISTLACAFSGGDGTAGNPYQIATRQHLEAVNSDPNAYYGASYILVNDIDFAGTTYIQAVIAADISTEYDFQGTKFTGSFNGNGFAIKNLTISAPEKDGIGLFGYVGRGAVITNLGVEDVNITGKSDVGGLVGKSEYGAINSCHSTGTVKGAIDGIAGGAGGLVGENYHGTVNQSYSQCAVVGKNTVGGLIGDNRYGSISLCYSTGAISGTGNYVGGLVGSSNWGTVSFCYSTGTVYGTGTYIGGLIGWDSWGQITSCYSTGAVNGANKVGGLEGENSSGTISFCYTTCAVSGTTEVGSLFGSNNKPDGIISCFWDTQTSGQDRSTGGKGMSTAQMKTMSIFANAGWAGKGWVMDDGNDYPRLEFEQTGGAAIADAPLPPFAGNGTAEEPYLIYTPQEFALLSSYYDVLDKHILLMNDIDMTGVLLYPIGELGALNGIFDGNGKTVSNVVINNQNSNFVGLFSCIGTGGEVKNLGIENINVIGSDHVGGLVGDNLGTVSSCYSTGSVSGNSYVGALTGYNRESTVSNCYSTGSVNGTGNYVGGLAGYYNYGNISRCYSTCSVSGTGTYTGGLVGYIKEITIVCCYSTGSAIGNGRVGGLIGYRLNGTLRYCYSTASATGTEYVGGLIGEDHGELRYCYSTGFVSGTSKVGGLLGSGSSSSTYLSYWDRETSGRTSSAGGTSRTTVQMKRKTTYSGWNFQNLFTIDEGVTYPRFRDMQSYSLPQDVELTELTGSGTVSDPYIITNADELNAARKDLNAHYRLGNDIDLSNSIIWNDFLGWQPIGEGTNGFKGTFDGDGFAIRGLTISGGTGYVGLFGYIDSGAVVKNLGIENAVVIGSNNVGGLAGCNSGGTIRYSYVSGAINGAGSSTGGLVGENKLSGTIISCYSVAAVAPSTAGGLVGTNTAAILYSFWDMEASGRTASAGGTGKTTAQMKTQATYAGWNFNLLWKIDEGITYPTLRSTSIYSLPQNIELSELAGNGTSNSPYIISNADQLNAVRKNLNAHYRMSNDIDLIDSLVWNNSSGWEPIGTLNADFKGTFDGNGYVVRNIIISTGADYIGLFGCLGSAAVVRNLGIEDITITGNNYAGGLTGLNSGTVNNCYSTDYTAGNSNIGGLIGQNSSGNISDCYTAGSISGNSHIGGLVGYNVSGNILECSSTSSVSGGYNGGQNTGGLVGYNSAGYINDCYTAGSVSGAVNIGGLVGNNLSGTTINCYSTSLVTGGNNTGGLIGTTSAGLVGYCYFTGSVNAGTNVGGLVGMNSGGTIIYSYSSGLVQAASIYAGGLVGNSSGVVYFSFWDIEASGQTTSSGGTGKTTVEMKTKTTYTGWNFGGLWEISDSEGYPTLSGTQIYSQPRDVQVYQLAGNGSAEYPFIITNADELNAVRQSLNAHYRLGNNIDLADSIVWNNFLGWQPIGTDSEKFNGTFDGNGFVIKNLTISRSSDYVGLFGYIGSGAVIKNVGVEDAAVIGKQYVGCLAGWNNYGTIIRCYSTGQANGSRYIGGLVGTNIYGKVQYCYSKSSARGTEADNVGGLIGSDNEGSIKYCYSTGAVSGRYNLGGLVGSTSTKMPMFCFWDTETSGQTISGGGTGKTTAQMKMQATYTGWNFNAFWTINEGLSYPELRNVSNYSLPRNIQLSQLSGSGTIDDPYIITNADELNALRKDLNAHYRLGNDIELIDSIIWDNFQGWQPIGTYNTGFNGTLDGNGFTINNLSISRESDYVGLFGSISGSSAIKNVTIKNAVITGLSYAGALVGYNFGTIRLCRSTGQITGNDYVGGLLGQNNSYDYVSNCYSSVAVSGRSNIGGLIGCQGSSSNAGFCYSTGSVSGNYNVGGLVGYNYGGAFGFCYWDTESSGKATSAAGTGKTTAQMKMRSTYENWNFALWAIDEGVSYPTLIDIRNYSLPRDIQLSELVGSGTVEDPYILTNADELNAVRKDLKAHYRLANDIDIIDSVIWNDFAGWEPVGTQSGNFTGTFDGNGYAIKNLNIDGYGTNVGLFGYLGLNSAVKDLGIINANIYNGVSGAGCLAGYNRGTITRCYSTGSIRGLSIIGGLVGANAYGSITYCYSSGTVNAFTQTSGGLIGANSGPVAYCYSKCTTSANKYSGGLIGYNSGTVSSCYSAGAVSGALNYGGLIANNLGNAGLCFWDTETSQQTTSQGGVGQTTAQMKTLSTFIDAGWDFVNETANGLMDAWDMQEGDYPRLYWQAAKGDVNYDGCLNESDLRVMISQWLSSAQTNQRLAADINNDSTVDFADFSILSYASTYIGADFNRDGIIDERDLVILVSDWLAQGQQVQSDINNDSTVDMMDFAVLADTWLTNGY